MPKPKSIKKLEKFKGERANPKKEKHKELDKCLTVSDLKDFIKKYL